MPACLVSSQVRPPQRHFYSALEEFQDAPLLLTEEPAAQQRAPYRDVFIRRRIRRIAEDISAVRQAILVGTCDPAADKHHIHFGRRAWVLERFYSLYVSQVGATIVYQTLPTVRPQEIFGP